MIKIKRIYDPAESGDGYRVLVDRLWPRGIAKDKAKVDRWLKEIAPSNELRKWYGHDPDKWDEFRRKYKTELKAVPEAVSRLKEIIDSNETVTLLYSSKENTLNNAVALKEILAQTNL